VFPELTLAGLSDGISRKVPRPGNVNLVVLWAAWCAPCRVEMPRIQALVRAHASRGLTAAGIAVHIPEEIERDAASRFVAEAGILFPVFQVDDPSYEQLDLLAQEMGRPGLVLPTVFIVDRGGRVLDVLGGDQVGSLGEAIEALLSGSPEPRPGERARN
jgi:thiol-disulfide isomerase/thioredoxin